MRIIFLRWLLFETRIGQWLVAGLERRAGLALVDAEWLGEQRVALPAAAGDAG